MAMMNPGRRRTRFWIRAIGGLGVGLLVMGSGSIARTDGDANSADINRRLYRQLDGNPSAEKIETVAGQMYIPKEHIDRDVINDAIATMLAENQGSEASIAIRRPARVNFEIHFNKNSAELTDESRRGLDQLGEVLGSDYLETRFILGGHTDLDGNDAINEPLSQARAESARAYLIEAYEIASDRIVAKGFGTSEPLHEIEKSADDKRYNRRVDLRPIRNNR
jgi:outer membrane protein OmpA-like peptidoglycan-associated protein